MLAAPLSALIWFLAAPPDDAARSYAATWLLAAVLVAGAVATGLTQRGHWRAGAGTLGAALFAAVATVALGFTFSPEPAGIDPPAIALTHAATASMAGVIGAAAAAPVVGVTSGHRSRIRIGLAAAGLGAATAVLMVELLMPPT